ncbi:MAG TPA: MFS transporter [Candidatus Limnocylindrales bacterium]|nr:MFS transporter [Candidatus Limnocylindrales bacterium]
MTLRQRLVGARILRPLRRRDYALLVGGAIASLLGDGFFYVALAWQVYAISNVPTALSLVLLAISLPNVLLVLVGGVFADRYDRRRLMVAADIVRAAALGVIALLSAAGVLELWHIAALVVFVGAGDAFFNPASTAILPDLVPDDDLASANALAGIYRPVMIRMVGPALAGLVVAAFGPAPAFAVDGASFLVSALAVWSIRTRPAPRAAADHGLRATVAQVGEGLRYARSKPWIWATLVAAMLSLLVFIGPIEVLVPFIIKNKLALGPEALGLIFAVGGIGSLAMSLVIGVVGLPRRRVTAMYVAWSLGVAATALYGAMTSLWQALLVSFVLQASFMLGSVIWTTMLQQLVPRELLGRISSLDWMMSVGLVPLSFALTGPIADAIGPETTLIWAGILGAIFMFALIFVPGVRDPERDPAMTATAGVATPAEP